MFRGTSAAAPHVTGVVALILECNPHLDAIQVRGLLEETARHDQFTGLVTPNNDWGYGKIDAYRAIWGVSDGDGRIGIPRGLRLFPPHPNPFSEATTFVCEQAGGAFTEGCSKLLDICVYDIRGRLIRKLFNSFAKRRVELSWDGRDNTGFPVTSGVYVFVVRQRNWCCGRTWTARAVEKVICLR